MHDGLRRASSVSVRAGAFYVQEGANRSTAVYRLLGERVGKEERPGANRDFNRGRAWAFHQGGECLHLLAADESSRSRGLQCRGEISHQADAIAHALEPLTVVITTTERVRRAHGSIARIVLVEPR